VSHARKAKRAYCLDKSSGRAFVTLNGRRTYLGKHGTPASRDEYDRVIGEWIAAAAGRGAKPQNEDLNAPDRPCPRHRPILAPRPRVLPHA
jgi:hypothetical protein